MNNLIEIKIICSSISLSTSLTVAILFLLNNKLRTPTYRLVLQLQIADALFAIASIMNSYNSNQSLCQFQAFMVNYSRESSIIWIALFAYNMYATIVDNQELPGLFRFYLVAIIIPIILSVYPFIGDAYGLDYALCWLTPDNLGYVIVNYFLICIGTLFYIIFFYIKTFQFLNYVTKNKPYKLFLYPITFFVTQIWTMIDIFTNEGNDISSLKYIAMAFVCLQGFINSLVYGLTPQVLEIVRQFCQVEEKKIEPEINLTQCNICKYVVDTTRTHSLALPVSLDSRTQSNTSVQQL